MFRDCTGDYNKSFEKQVFTSLDDINKFLELKNLDKKLFNFGEDPACFEIMSYRDFKEKLITENEKFDINRHSVDICNPLSPSMNADQKIKDKAVTAESIANEIRDIHRYTDKTTFVLVKNVSKKGKLVIAMAVYEISPKVPQDCYLHYICKCSNGSLSDSCINMPKVAALLIYYLAFWARDIKKCTTLRLSSDGKGGASLQKYYEGFGFVPTGDKGGDDIPMAMNLTENMSFSLTRKPEQQPATGGAKTKDRFVKYKGRTYKLLKDGRLNCIKVGKTKTTIYLKDITGEYSWKL